MGIIALSDPSGQYEAIAFSDTLDACREKLEPGNCVLLSVSAREEEEGVSVRIGHVEPLEKLAAKQSTTLTVFLDRADVIESIDRLIGHQGMCSVRLVALTGANGHSREVELALKEPRAVSRSVANAIKAMPGVIDVAYA